MVRAFNQLSMIVDSKVDPDAFRKFVSENESILDFPLSMQRTLRSSVVGERFWKKQVKFRNSTHGRKYVPIRVIIKASHKSTMTSDGFRIGVKKQKSIGAASISPSPLPIVSSAHVATEVKEENVGDSQDWTTATASPKQTVSHKSRGLTRALSSSAM